MAVKTKIQLRRGTASAWAASNPVLAAGEIGLETDTSNLKIGNGSTAWNSLPYTVLALDAIDTIAGDASIQLSFQVFG